ncbi:DEAD-box ATP-dependent RNA helicase 58, chloroplastic isoform X2 [Impatiens glandulifera]|nr:DEAD-box ATP-dependent RNA helicase 58, chloroplastic isoform X2 [Impatiens glandulifera]
MQVTKVARMLAVKSTEEENDECSVMALLDGGMLKRQRSWLKAEPPTIVVATMGSLNQMVEKHLLKLEALRVLVIDEVDSMFGHSTQVGLLRKLLTSYTSPVNKTRQTILASASIPQHNRFLYDCVQQKWTKADVIHINVNPVQPMPSQLYHRFVVCGKEERCQILLSLLQADVPGSSIVFVNEQSEKSKKAGHDAITDVLINFLTTSSKLDAEILVLEEDMNFNSRAASLTELRQEKNFLLLATDLAARGVDLPETTHIYNFDLPRTAVDYLHRAGRTGRRPFSKERCTVTTFISKEERFVLQRYENELRFDCAQLPS